MDRTGKATPKLVGGRYLDAVAKNPNLGHAEKAVLQAITSQLNINGDYREERWMFVANLIERTSLSRATVFRALKKLEENQYIVRRQRRDSQTKALLASAYMVTGKIFYEQEERQHLRLITDEGSLRVSL
jgi:DNA-binding IclR family transcriptional regulator